MTVMSEYTVRVRDTLAGTLIAVEHDGVVGPGVPPEQARVLADRLVEAARGADRQNEGCA